MSFVYVCTAGMAAYIVFTAVSVFCSEINGFILIKYLAAALLLCALVTVFSRLGKDETLHVLCLLAVAFAVRFLFILRVDTQPESDFALVYETAKKLAAGKNVLNDSVYFSTWAYQSGYVLFLAFFIRFFSAGLLFFKSMNCLLSTVTTLLVYLLARRMVSAQGARIAGWIYALYPGTICYCSVLTPQHLSEMLLLLAVFLFTMPGRTKRQSFVDAAAAGAVLSLSNVARPTAIILVLAFVAYAVLRCIGGGGGLRRVLVRTLIVVACFYLCMACISTLVKATDVNRNGLSNMLPEWKFIVGLDQKANGQYNPEDVDRVFHAQNQTQAARTLLSERLKITVPQFFDLAYRKSLLMWGSPEADYWAFSGSVREELAAVYGEDVLPAFLTQARRLSSALYIWIYVLTALGGFAQARKKQVSEVYLLLALAALAYFCAHTCIEIQPRYRSLMYALTFPLTANGVQSCRNWLFRKGKSAKRRARRVSPCAVQRAATL